MIQANELRIGNWVNFGVLTVPIKSIHTESVLENKTSVYVKLNDKLSNYCLDIKELHPIPLTEEILLNKCNGYYDSFISDNDCIIIDCTDDISIGWCGFLFLYIDGAMIRINNANSNYLHQLQNLYFALTGTELEINFKK